jgi:hypothetical protein
MAAARVFKVEFRIAVAQRILNRESVSSLSSQYKIKRSVLYRWRDSYREKGTAGFGQPRGPPVPHHVTQRGNARQFILGCDPDQGVYLGKTWGRSPRLLTVCAYRRYPNPPRFKSHSTARYCI